MASGIPYGTKGIQDPFQCRTESRRTYAKMSQQTMTELLTPVGECMCLPSSYNTSKHPLEQPGGSLTGELPNPAVKREILRRIRHEDVNCARKQYLQDSPIIHGRQVYTIQATNNLCSQARKNPCSISILAQMEYSYRVRYYDEQGVPFKTIPEGVL